MTTRNHSAAQDPDVARFTSSVAPRLAENLDLVTRRFAEEIVCRAMRAVEITLEDPRIVADAIGTRLIASATTWLAAIRRADALAAADAIEAARAAYCDLLAYSNFADTARGRALGAAAGKLAAAVGVADRAWRMAALVAH